MSTTKKLRWCPEEDARLKLAVGSHTSSSGAIDWKIIASIMGRSTKQVRERYVNVLDPSIKRCAWTHEEIVTLFAAQTELGNRWSSIAARLPGRPETAVKNTFYAAVRRHKRRQLAMRNGLPLPPIYHEAMNSIPNIDMIAATTHAAATQMPSDKAAMRKRSKHHHASAGPAAPRHMVAPPLPLPSPPSGGMYPPPHRLGAHGEIAAPGTVFTGARHPFKAQPHVGTYVPQPRYLVVNRAEKLEGPTDPLTAWITSDPFSTSAGIDAFLDPLLDESELDAAVGAAAAVSGHSRSIPTTVTKPPRLVRAVTVTATAPATRSTAPAATATAAAAATSSDLDSTVTKLSSGRRATRSGATKRDVESDSSDVEYAPSVSTTDDEEDDIDSVDLDEFTAPASAPMYKRKNGPIGAGASGFKAPAPLKLEDLFKFSYTEYPVQVVAGPGLPLVPGVLLTTSEHDLLKVSHPSALGLDSMLDTLNVDLPSDQDDDDFSWFTQGDALPPVTMPPLSIAI